LTKNGPGALHLLSSNSYTGGTIINGGTLGIATGSLGSLPAVPTIDVTINNGAALRFNVDLNLNANHQLLLGTGGGSINTNGHNDGITGVISGSSLTKTGAGTLTLSNTNTYTDGTTVSAGTLLVNSIIGSGTGTGAVTVNTGAVLGGTGTIQGNVTNSGTLAPGSSAGTLHVGGNFAQNASGNFQVELASLASYDKLIAGGTGTLAGTLTVSLTNGFVPQAGNTFEILTATGFGGSTFTTKNLPTLSGNLGWSVDYGATSVTLSVSAGLQGDFNGNGVVDGADYVTWRDGLGTVYQQSDYDVWRSHFGQTPGTGSGGSLAGVPEPAACSLLGVGTLLFALQRRRVRVAR
jgi:autotransporter-associated beta strand protein